MRRRLAVPQPGAGGAGGDLLRYPLLERLQVNQPPASCIGDLAAMLRERFTCSNEKAVRELGYRPRTLEEMFRDCHGWLAGSGRLADAAVPGPAGLTAGRPRGRPGPGCRTPPGP
jgi:hypothetical protein